MACATQLLKTQIKGITTSLAYIKEEVKDLYKVYWATDANTTIAGVGSDTDPVTVATKLSKGEFVNGVTMIQQMDNFFSNLSVTAGDYMGTSQNIKYGNETLASQLSVSVENMGDRLYTVAVDSIELFKQCNDALNNYFSNEINDMIANLDNQRCVAGSGTTKDNISLGITLVEQWKKLLNNEAVTQSDYASTIGKWEIVE